jgi:hypothetical protein
MSTTAVPAPTGTAPGVRRMETDLEPLTIPNELRANSLVDLVHRTVQRNPA